MVLDSSLTCLNLGSAVERALAAFEVGSRSDRGRVRQNNEDSLVTAPELGLFILSDGMGGLARGEVASQLTVNAIVDHCRRAHHDARLPLQGKRLANVSETANRLASAIQWANLVVHQAARESTTPGEMGATVVAVQCAKERLSVAHVGDSRVYRLRNHTLEQLTEDHSLANERARLDGSPAAPAGIHPYQNVLTRAVGIDAEVAVDVADETLLGGDTVLLCSDGLTRELSDKQIAAILRDAKSAQGAADKLIEMANEAGGEDNVSVVVVRPLSPAAPPSGGRLRKWIPKFGS